MIVNLIIRGKDSFLLFPYNLGDDQFLVAAFFFVEAAEPAIFHFSVNAAFVVKDLEALAADTYSIWIEYVIHELTGIFAWP